jgi:hypothetical protein
MSSLVSDAAGTTQLYFYFGSKKNAAKKRIKTGYLSRVHGPRA